MSSLGLLILRLGAAGLMLTHGWQKLQVIIGGNEIQFGNPIGIGSDLSFYLVTFAEFGAAILLILGLFTKLAAIPLVIAMAVAGFVVHAGRDDAIAAPLAAEGQGNYELVALYFFVFLGLMFTGAGEFSIDGMRARRK